MLPALQRSEAGALVEPARVQMGLTDCTFCTSQTHGKLSKVCKYSMAPLQSRPDHQTSLASNCLKDSHLEISCQKVTKKYSKAPKKTGCSRYGRTFMTMSSKIAKNGYIHSRLHTEILLADGLSDAANGSD